MGTEIAIGVFIFTSICTSLLLPRDACWADGETVFNYIGGAWLFLVVLRDWWYNNESFLCHQTISHQHFFLFSHTDPGTGTLTMMRMAEGNYFMAMEELNSTNTRATHLWMGYTKFQGTPQGHQFKLQKEGFLEKNGLNLLIRKHQNVRFQTRRFCVEMYRTLLPRIKASPYLFFSWPLAYSSVWSSAIFMYPSRQARTPVNVYRMIPDLFYNRKYTRITSVINTTVQLYNNWTPMDLIDELGESFLARHFTKNLSFLPETRIFVYNNITSNLWSSRFH